MHAVKRHAPLALCLALFAIYCGHFIRHSSFVEGGVRTYALFDDAMISMRYASNLAAGHGLVYNPGERVEGITNLLWTLYMAGVHTLGVSPAKIGLVIQLTSALILLLNLFFVYRLALFWKSSRTIATLAVLLTASFFSLNFWSLFGMEVGLVTLLLTASFYAFVRGHAEGRDPWLPHLLMGLAILVRLDAAVLYVALVAGLALVDARLRWRRVGTLLLTLVVAIGSQTLFRYLYYGDLLPNTYYLKMSNVPVFVRIKRGAIVLLGYLWKTGFAVWLAAVFTALATWRRRPEIVVPLAAVVGAELAYAVYVGGDAWDFWGMANRFLSSIMPLVLLLLAVGIVIAADRLAALAVAAPWRRLARWPLVAAGAVVVFLSFNLVIYEGPSRYAFAQYLRMGRCDRVYYNQLQVKTAVAVEAVTTEDATVLVTRAGTLPYFLKRYVMDGMGKCDSVIARGPSHPEIGFWPGHTKWDYDYSLGEGKPDLVAEVWHIGWAQAEKWLQRDYRPVRVRGFDLYARTGSPRIRWDVVEPVADESLGRD